MLQRYGKVLNLTNKPDMFYNKSRELERQSLPFVRLTVHSFEENDGVIRGGLKKRRPPKKMERSYILYLIFPQLENVLSGDGFVIHHSADGFSKHVGDGELLHLGATVGVGDAVLPYRWYRQCRPCRQSELRSCL